MTRSSSDRRSSAHARTGRGRPSGSRGAQHGEPDAGQADGRRPEAYTQVRLRSPDGPLRAREDPLRDLPRVRRDDRTMMGLPPRSRLSRLVADLGWRAYAIPLLVIATLFAVVSPGGEDPASTGTLPAADSSAGATQPAPQQTVFVDGPANNKPAANLPSSALPSGAPFAEQGNGEFDLVPGTSQVYGQGPLKTFTVEVEQGIDVDQKAFAAEVESILGDKRGWTHDGRVSFQRVDAGSPDFRVTLTTPMTVRRPDFCGFEVQVETSCYNRQIDRVVINVARWVRGAVAFRGDLSAYHAYAITHETGHALDHGHEACPANGAPAPPMMQQTLGLTSANGKTCKPNPWPYPSGDKEITGPETKDSPR